jgi:hypothetical protein
MVVILLEGLNRSREGGVKGVSDLRCQLFRWGDPCVCADAARPRRASQQDGQRIELRLGSKAEEGGRSREEPLANGRSRHRREVRCYLRRCARTVWLQ